MSTRRKSILIAEDNAAMRKIIGFVVAEEEFELLEVSDGLEALKVAKRCKPDLVLLDLGMPLLDGLEVCRRLRADPEMLGTKIVAVTAWAAPEDRLLALEAGVNDYLTKPFSPTKLLRSVRSMLGDPLGASPA